MNQCSFRKYVFNVKVALLKSMYVTSKNTLSVGDLRVSIPPLPTIVSKYDQEIPQLQTTDKHVA